MLVSDEERAALQDVLHPGGGLGGRDHRVSTRPYSDFDLVQAWRYENLNMLTNYESQKKDLKDRIRHHIAQGIKPLKVKVRAPFWTSCRGLPGHLDEEVSELYLLHGTKPDVLMEVLNNGLNERFSGGMFGDGTYFAEDAAKTDNYSTLDVNFGDHP